jgi:ubiquinone/menaquinone biosynthesis C-methylase UbiE
MDFDNFSQNYIKIHNQNIAISGETSEYFSEYKIKSLDDFYLRYGLKKDIKILDLGCGIGKLEKFFPQYFPQAKIWGIDPSQESIQISVRENKNINIVFSIFDGKHIPFDTNFFDAIVISTVLHHVPLNERQALIQECYRVLSPKGHIFVFEHNPLNILTKYIVKTCVFDKDAHLLTANVSKRLLEQSNFKIKELDYIVFFPKILKSLRPLEKKLRWCCLGAQYFIVGYKQ